MSPPIYKVLYISIAILFLFILITIFTIELNVIYESHINNILSSEKTDIKSNEPIQKDKNDISHLETIKSINEDQSYALNNHESKSEENIYLQKKNEREYIKSLNSSKVNEIVKQENIKTDKNINYSNAIIHRGAKLDRNQLAKTKDVMLNNTPDGEILDWWTSVVDIFKKGTIATVIDIETGKSFKVKRTYGTNHADCETLTSTDTEIMKEIWDGEWNWSRRAIIVVVNGRRIAGSANGMPHAGLDGAAAGEYLEARSAGYGSGYNLDEVKGNNMDGHICIHFLNSKTHKNEKVDDTHQIMVLRASGLIE